MKLFSIMFIFINFYIVKGQDEFRLVSENKNTYSKKLNFYSKILGQNESVNISLPESFYEASSEHEYPVFIVLEDHFFQIISSTIKYYSSFERMPEMIVVSIVGGPVVPKVYTNGSDFWPADWKQLPFGENPDKFVAYLKKELFPYLEKNFRANKYRTVMGFSGTSLFTFHSLVKEPGLFNDHIAIACGDILGMGYKEGESFIDLFEKSMKKNPHRKVNLYAISADSDVSDAPKIGKNLELLEKRLAAYRLESFKFISKVYPGERHYDVSYPGLAEAIEMIFPQKDWAPRYLEIIKKKGSVLKNFENFYQNLSKKYGFRILPRAERWNSGNNLGSVAGRLLRDKRIKESIELYELRFKYRPKSAVAAQDLSKAYQADSQLEKSLLNQEKAVSLAKFSGLNVEKYEERLLKLKSLTTKKP